MQDTAPVVAPVKTADVKKISGDSGNVYTVAKGDNPVAIARKLHVSYDTLLKLNKIEDPTKLQIGQKLRIPVKNKPVRADS
jgi:2',3'-cyclic-nucleotide 2'-phosphodiesterase/3'-nucleotidase